MDEASTLKQPSLHMSAAAASRDVTLFNAMNLLHESNYDFAKAALSLVSNGSPRYIFCKILWLGGRGIKMKIW